MTVAERLLSRINQYTARLDELRRQGIKDWKDEEALLRLLQIQAQALLDLVVHVASQGGYTARSPRDAARFLLEEGLLEKDEYDFIGRVVGFRNVLVHGYADVDLEIARRILEQGEYHKVADLAARIVERALRKGWDP